VIRLCERLSTRSYSVMTPSATKTVMASRLSLSRASCSVSTRLLSITCSVGSALSLQMGILFERREDRLALEARS
jgi:hypothetical protein